MNNKIKLRFLEKELAFHELALKIVPNDKDFKEGIEVLKEVIKEYKEKEQNYE